MESPSLYMNNNIFYHNNYLGNEPLYPIPDPITPARKPQIEYPNRGSGFKIGVTPGAVVGALVGGAIAKSQVKKEEQKRILNQRRPLNEDTPAIEGNYYKQVQNVANNLNVIFTPVSAIYVVKNGKKDFTLDTIETNEMNDDMRLAWKNKDDNYFKSVMMSKMFTEMQIAEQGFAKEFARKQLGIKDMITKDASDTSFIDDMNEIEIIAYVKKVAPFFQGSEIKEKLASAVIDDMENEAEEYSIDLSLERPFTKYAGVISGISSSLGLGTREEDLNAIKKKLENPSYTMKNIKVGFFPDRVIFSLGNKLVSTLPLTAMNEEGYSHFENQNAKYFKNFFAEHVKENLNKKAEISISSAIEKVASDDLPSDNDPASCLKTSDAHPVAIYLILCQRFGMEWLQYDIAVMEDIVKSEFDLDEIPETNSAKISAILMANQSDNVYINAYAFEKTVLSLCSKPVDFLQSQVEDINIQDIVFAIDVLDRVTPFDDIYDNFSKETLNYMATVLANKEIYVYNPTNIIGSDLEPAFNETLNELLVRTIKNKMTLNSISREMDEDIFAKCEYIADNSLGLLKSIRRLMNEKAEATQINKGDLVDSIIAKKGIREDLSTIIRRQVILNLALDDVLVTYENTLMTQLQQYNISRPAEEGVINE